MHKDRVPDDFGESVELANKLIQESYLFAARIALFQELQPGKSLPYDMHEQLEELNDGVDEISHLDITFSGVGCVPVLLPDGDVDSMYGIADLYTGNLEGFDLSDPTDMSGIDESDLDDYAEDEGTMLYDNKEFIELQNRLVVPPKGLRLFTEFFLESEGAEEIAGAAVRASSVDHYAIIDSSTLKITSMDIYEEPECYGSEDLTDRLIEAAASMRSILTNTKFRRQTRQVQIRTLEHHLEKLNSEMAIDRFCVVMRPDEIYVPDTTHENYRMVRVRVPNNVKAFTSQCLRIDSMEHFLLTDWSKRITQTKSMRDPKASFCLVAEIDEDTRQQLKLPTNIIWLPVRPLGRTKRKREGYVDPIFDGIFIDG